MKKWIMLLLVMSVLSSAVLASSSVSDAIDNMVAQNEEILMVVGDASNTNDILAATDIGILLNETKNKAVDTKLVSEVSSISQPTVLIGGPCANPFTEEVMGVTCAAWPYQQGQGIVSSYEYNGQTVIVVAGTLEGDTRRMGKEFQKYETSSKLQGSTTALFGKAEVVGGCGNDICETGETDQTCAEDCSDDGSVQLVSTSGHKHSPKISGNNVIWSKRSDGIVLYKGSTGEIVTALGGRFASIDGDYIVDDNLGVYKISTGQKTSIPGEQLQGEAPAVHNNKVVFTQSDDSCESGLPCKVYMYDLNTEEKTLLFTANRPSGLAMYGNWVVYSDEPGDVDYPDPLAFPEIYAYNIQNGQNKRVTTAELAQYHPEIYGTTIVWEDSRGGDRDVYAYDLSTHQEWRVTSALSNQIWPMIDGDIITWIDYRNGNEDVYYCELSKNGLNGGCLADDVKTRVTYSSLHQGTVDVSNNVLAWIGETSSVVVPDPSQAYAGGGYTDKSVYVFQIPDSGLPAGFVVPS